MKDEPRPVDYTKIKTAALRPLATGGDVAALRELVRRGVDVAVDTATLDYSALRRLVLAWRDGTTPDERARTFDLARRAQFELECRYRVDDKLWNGTDPAPAPPPPPPWEAPRPPRCLDWQRPQGSKLYPSDADVTAAQLNARAREVYRKRRT